MISTLYHRVDCSAWASSAEQTPCSSIKATEQVSLATGSHTRALSAVVRHSMLYRLDALCHLFFSQLS